MKPVNGDTSKTFVLVTVAVVPLTVTTSEPTLVKEDALSCTHTLSGEEVIEAFEKVAVPPTRVPLTLMIAAAGRDFASVVPK